MKSSCVPDKSVIVPPFVYSTEGYDPAKCDKLNEQALKEYHAKILAKAVKENSQTR